MAQFDVVKMLATGFQAHELVHVVLAEFAHCESVIDGLRTRLKAEDFLRVPDAVSIYQEKEGEKKKNKKSTTQLSSL